MESAPLPYSCNRDEARRDCSFEDTQDKSDCCQTCEGFACSSNHEDTCPCNDIHLHFHLVGFRILYGVNTHLLETLLLGTFGVKSLQDIPQSCIRSRILSCIYWVRGISQGERSRLTCTMNIAAPVDYYPQWYQIQRNIPTWFCLECVREQRIPKSQCRPLPMNWRPVVIQHFCVKLESSKTNHM